MSYFSKNLKYLRKENNISRSELADKLKINQSTIARWENDNMGATVDNAYDVSQFFHVSIADLVGKDLENVKKQTPTELLFDKTKDILSADDRDTIEFIMKKTIEKYENSKKDSQ